MPRVVLLSVIMVNVTYEPYTQSVMAPYVFGLYLPIWYDKFVICDGKHIESKVTQSVALSVFLCVWMSVCLWSVCLPVCLRNLRWLNIWLSDENTLKVNYPGWKQVRLGFSLSKGVYVCGPRWLNTLNLTRLYFELLVGAGGNWHREKIITLPTKMAAYRAVTIAACLSFFLSL